MMGFAPRVHLLLAWVVVAMHLSSQVVLAAALPKIKWGPCPAVLGAPSNVQCANVSVPLDYSHPNGATTNVGLARIKTNATKPRGTVYYNPGGPGGSGARSTANLAKRPSDPRYALLKEYNFIGYDPRGVGISTPLKCDPKLWNKRVPTMPTSEAEYNTLVQHWKDIGTSCRKMTGPLLDHLDTDNVARDLDLVRRANGDSKLNYLGLSYGTQIGTAYAEMFPESINRVVLDGMLEHSQDGSSFVQTEALTWETTLKLFFDWCKTNSSCPISNDPQGTFLKAVARADAKPIPAPGCKQSGDGACQPDVNVEDLFNNVQGSLIPGESAWPDLGQAILDASKGNATAFSMPYFTSNIDTQLTGTWPSFGVGCQDWFRAKSYADIRGLNYQTNTLTPLTRGYTQAYTYFSRCIAWPTALTNPPRPFKSSIQKAPPMLFVNAFYDPSTSVQWAIGIKEDVTKSHLVFRNGTGHTSASHPGDTSSAIVKYLLGGALPADGTVYQS